jgi:hypothetical protein
MKEKTRACIAFIAGTIISKRANSCVYDCTRSEYINVDAEIRPGEVKVYDHSRSCHISGSGNSGKYKLYDHGNDKPINLTIKGQYFDGYDFDTAEDFGGSVSGTVVCVYDYEHSRWFNYWI